MDGNCNGAYGVITPADGRLGFGISSPCGTYQTQEAGPAHLFKIRRCGTGAGTFKIYRNSNQTTLLQTITIESEL